MSRLDDVRIVEFDPCSACTRRCWFCDPGVPRHRREHPVLLDRGRHDAIVQELGSAGYTGWVVYAGHGEPLLHPEIVSLVAGTSAACPKAKICIYTNGDILLGGMADRLDGAGLDLLVWDCYGKGPGQYDAASKWVAQILGRSPLGCHTQVIDHVARPFGYSSRTGNVPGCCNAPRVYDPCYAPAECLFLTAEGYWILCCEDYGHNRLWRVKTVAELLALEDRMTLVEDVAAGRRLDHTPCRKCDRGSGRFTGFHDQPFDIWRAGEAARCVVGG